MMIGPAPDRRRVALHDEAERNELDPMRLERLDPPLHHHRPLEEAEHPRNVGSVDVAVHQSNAMALQREGDGHVRRDRAFPDSTLA
jgi:hypothetical protein